MNLYELSARFEQLMDQDEYSEVDSIELEKLHENIEDACISRAKYIRNKEAELAAVVEARKQMQEREKALTKKIENNELHLANIMTACNLPRITKCPEFPIRITKNRTSVDAYSESEIPELYWRVQEKVIRSVDKDFIRKALEEGREIPGCRLVTKTRVEYK